MLMLMRAMTNAKRLGMAATLGAALVWGVTGCGPAPSSNNAPVGTPGGSTDQPDSMTNAAARLATLKAASKKGQEFILALYGDDMTKGQWGANVKFYGLNGLALNGLLRAVEPIPPSHEKIAATFDALIKAQERDGAWVSPQQGNAVYETAVVLRALVEAARLDAEFAKRDDVRAAVMRGRDYLLLAQIDEVPEFEGDYVADENDPFYGGWGYGRIQKANRSPANMSTTNLAFEAIHESVQVVPPRGDEVEQAKRKLQNFLKNNHNLAEFNGQPYNQNTISKGFDDPGDSPETRRPGNDGGGMYSPGSSKAGYNEGQGGLKSPRSYGSMTYALLRLYHMAGVKKTDPRIASALNWVTKAENFTFAHNPGFADPAQHHDGHFYYLYTATYTLAQLVEGDTLKDSKGENHNWKAVLAEQIIGLQAETGAWTNPKSPRWDEGNPVIAAGYLLSALGYLK